MNDVAKNLLLWTLIITVLLSLFGSFNPETERANYLNYTQFRKKVDQGEVETAEFNGQNINGQLSNGENFNTYMPLEDTSILHTLYDKDVSVNGRAPEQQSFLLLLFVQWTPFIVLIALWLWVMRQPCMMSKPLIAASYIASRELCVVYGCKIC